MPLTIPTLDDRRYQDLLDEALARIPVHNPEWTNFNRSDPGVTLIELFAFLTESAALPREPDPGAQPPEVPVAARRAAAAAASSARGIVAFANERGAARDVIARRRARGARRPGAVPDRAGPRRAAGRGEAVLQARARRATPELLREHYRQLYASFRGQSPQLDGPAALRDRAVRGLRPDGGRGRCQARSDGSLWIALLVRARDAAPTRTTRRQVREQLAGKTLSLGVVPVLDATRASRRARR